MAHIIELSFKSDSRGSLVDIRNSLPFDIKKVLFIYDVHEKRGGHKHKETIQGLICLNGSCEIFTDNGKEEKTFVLDSPDKCLILNPEDWHTMDKFSEGAILIVLASMPYNPDDYIYEKPTRKND